MTGAIDHPPSDPIGILIIGAGFAGLYAIHRMRSLGLSLRCVEKAPDVGGVWYWNRYPGARCDVESLQYSYSFSPELEQEWEWSERFSAQPEILAYVRHVADRFDLRRDITFGVTVTGAVWDEGLRLWIVTTDSGEIIRARFCVMASGSLSASRLPAIPGLETFRGKVYHTGHWPESPVDFRGRRVAVVGTGSSGIQAIPVIASEAAELVVFQRTPNFIIPARNRPMEPDYQAQWKADYAEHRARARQLGTLYEFSARSALEVDEQERQREYWRRWTQGGVNFVHSFNDIYTNLDANDTAAAFVRDRIREVVKDPGVAEALCPTDHPLGSKRICVASDYFETYNRDNVRLVDIRGEPIEAVTGTGIRTAGGEYPVDIIVFATGYDALTGALTRIEIRGSGGRTIQEKWADGPRNYLGLMTAGFPNMFVITGPGSPSVLVNMIVGIEHHVDWIADCIRHMQQRGATSIEAASAAEDAWVEEVNAAAERTLFVKANSWYLGANIPGKPRVFLPYAGGLARYRQICAEVADRGYEGFQIQ